MMLAGDLLSHGIGDGIKYRFIMGEDRKSTHRHAEEVIAAFDRERAEANELRRRHSEQVRSSRSNDRPAGNDHGSGRSPR
jgi:hypothetical protein